MRIKTDLSTFQRLSQCLSEIYPDVNAELLSSDPMLKKLGLTDTIPCIIELQATDEQVSILKNMAIQFEIDAFNLPEGESPSEDDKNYIKYLKYTWLFDFLKTE